MNAESAILMAMILLTPDSVFMVSKMWSINHLLNLRSRYTIINFNDNIQIVVTCGQAFKLL